VNDLSDLREESVSIQTSAGPLRLYPQRFEDIGAFSKLPADEPPVRRLRGYLPQIATHDADPAPDRQRDAIDEAFCEQLSDDEVERIAEVYLSVPAVRRSLADAEARTGLLRRADAETSSHYLDRILQAEHERQMEDLAATFSTFHERYGAPLSAALSDLDRHAARLKHVSTMFIDGHDLAGHERLSAENRSIQMASTANGSLGPEGTKQAHPDFADRTSSAELTESGLVAGNSEREAQVDLTRSIGWMTAQSASLLAKLSESATQFLRQFTDAAASSDVATRRMLRIALGGIVVAVLLSAAALVLALTTFMQQRDREQADARWHAAVTQSLKDNAGAAEDRFKAVSAQLQHLTERQSALATSSAFAAAVPSVEARAAATGSRREARPPVPSRIIRRKGTASR
jgi:hypothetical protein